MKRHSSIVPKSAAEKNLLLVTLIGNNAFQNRHLSLIVNKVFNSHEFFRTWRGVHMEWTPVAGSFPGSGDLAVTENGNYTPLLLITID